MALLGIALLGMLMIVATLLGGHWVRRWGNGVRRRTLPPEVMIPRASTSPPEVDANMHNDSMPNDSDTSGGSDTTVM
ncbi:MAG: hypothetical protein AAGD11_15280 [Planctomycetota bacterium]